MYGLVLTAGGARGAYQAGVLRRIGELNRTDRTSPFRIVAGASAGAINGIAIAAGSGNFRGMTDYLAEVWSSLSTESVYHTNITAYMKVARTLVQDLSLGGIVGGGQLQSLLDATPLRAFLGEKLKFDALATEIERGNLYAIAISATNYFSGKSYTFIQGQKGHPVWEKSRRVALAATLTLDHLCASTAIPVVFQPVPIRTPHGAFYFGDGAMRLTNPLSPAIRLGSTHLLAIGIRHQAKTETQLQDQYISFGSDGMTMKKPPLAQVMGVMFNSMFLDHLDADLEHLARINTIIASNTFDYQTLKEPIQPIQTLALYPSIDLGQIAHACRPKAPPIIRYLLDGLGSQSQESSDLLSYLLFHKSYIQELIALGYSDANARIDEIEHFLTMRET